MRVWSSDTKFGRISNKDSNSESVSLSAHKHEYRAPDGTSSVHPTLYDFPLRCSSRSATLNMATSPSTVNGYRVSCLSDPQFPVSTVSPFFSLQLNIWHQNFGIPVAVIMTTGVFLCLIEIQLVAADNVYDVRLRRDWFSYCTTTVPSCLNTSLGWYVPHIFIPSIVGCAPSSYQWVPVIIGPYISNFCYLSYYSSWT